MEKLGLEDWDKGMREDMGKRMKGRNFGWKRKYGIG